MSQHYSDPKRAGEPNALPDGWSQMFAGTCAGTMFDPHTLRPTRHSGDGRSGAGEPAGKKGK